MSTLLRDPYGLVKVYVDGSCSDNGGVNPIAGIGVWFNHDHPLNLSEKLAEGQHTNQKAEVIAATRAIEQARKNRTYSLHIYSDSEYVVKGITEWLPEWHRRGLYKANGEPIAKNLQLFLDLEDEERRMNQVVWEYVPAHQGHEGNEAADKLAKKATM